MSKRGKREKRKRTLYFQTDIRKERGYSGTSDKGPSEIGTTSLQRTLVAAPC